MKDRQFYNNPVFRLLAPIIIGVLVYLLILMFFDSIDMLADNFFSREVLFVIGLTYLILETNRLVIISYNAFVSLESRLILRMAMQYLTAILLVFILLSGALYLYFVYIEGFGTIQTELITFNALFFLVTVFYQLFFFSMVYLNRQNIDKVGKEEILRENLELELQSFKNQINPQLLFQSLEIIISALHSSKKQADRLVESLSRTYRYTLDNKHNDLVSLKGEIDSLVPLSEIFKSKYPGAVSVQVEVEPGKESMNIIPGTLTLLMENALTENIVSESLPLEFKVRANNDTLVVEYFFNEKISAKPTTNARLDFLCKAYGYYSEKGIEIIVNDQMKEIRIPLLEIEEE